MIKINCTSVWYDTLNDAALSFPIMAASWTCYEHCTTPRACQERWRMMQLDFSLFLLLWLTFHLSEKSELCFPLCCWVCHIQHMPHIHRTLPNTEVCEPEERWGFYLYLHHDNIMGGRRVIQTANILKVSLPNPLENENLHISSRTMRQYIGISILGPCTCYTAHHGPQLNSLIRGHKPKGLVQSLTVYSFNNN